MGNKVSDSRTLEAIAGAQKRPHPITTLLDLDILTDDTIPADTILKRGHSDCGTHVLFPHIDRRRQRSVAQLRNMSPYGEVWLSQEMISTLQTIGEWRVFIVNGSIIQTVHTHKLPGAMGQWVGHQVMSFWTLNEI